MVDRTGDDAGAELFALGWKPLALILAETLILLCFVLAGLFLFF